MARVQEPRRVDGGGAHDVKLEQGLARWVDASIISTDDAAAIRRFEHERASASPARIPLIAEALGFLGGALAAVAGVILVSRFWDDLSTAARLAFVGTGAVALVAAGRVVRRGDEPALAHLGSFLWALAVGAVAFFAGIVVVDTTEWRDADAVFLVGFVATVAAGLLWAWRPAPLQHVATFVAAAVTIGGAAGQVEHVEGRVVAIALWTFATLWVVMAGAGAVRPRGLAYSIGGALAVAVGRVLSGDQDAFAGDILSVLTALAFLAASVPAGSLALLWVGVVGVFVSVPIAVTKQFGDSAGAPLALLIAGAVLIAAAVVAARLVPQVRAQRARPARFSRRTITLALVAVIAAAAGVEAAVIPFAAVPTFPSLRSTPDDTLAGTVVFLRTVDDEPCVYVVPASGGRETKLLCREGLEGGPGGLTWNDAGNVVAHSYSERGPKFVEIDAATGSVVDEGAAPDDLGKERWSARPERTSDGAVLLFEQSEEARAVLRLQLPGEEPTTIFTTKGPPDYSFYDATWSPDGRYALVTDSEDRVLVVQVEGGEPDPRILVANGRAPAWSATR